MTSITVSAADISLMHVAAAYLDDASQWWRIAQLNGLSDPSLTWLPSPVTLLIPTPSTDLTDGVPIMDDTI